MVVFLLVEAKHYMIKMLIQCSLEVTFKIRKSYPMWADN